MESLPESSKTPIESLYRKCIESFGKLTQLLGPDSSDYILSACIPLSTVEDELGRFRVWAEDVGAHQTGQVSSDYRLREAPEIHGLVSELLRDLAQKLQEGRKYPIAIASGTRDVR